MRVYKYYSYRVVTDNCKTTIYHRRKYLATILGSIGVGSYISDHVRNGGNITDYLCIESSLGELLEKAIKAGLQSYWIKQHEYDVAIKYLKDQGLLDVAKERAIDSRGKPISHNWEYGANIVTSSIMFAVAKEGSEFWYTVHRMVLNHWAKHQEKLHNGEYIGEIYGQD